MERRAIVGGSLLAGLSTLMSPAAVEAAAGAEAAAADLEGVSDSIDQLRRAVERQFANVYTDKWQGVARIRQQQHTWMRSTQKYPDFIEVGLDVWDNIYDWHVVHQQPLNMTRDVRRPLHDGVHVHDAAAASRSGAGLRRLRVRRRQRAPANALACLFAGLAAQHGEQHEQPIPALREAV